MIFPEMKALDSTDYDLEDFSPDDPECFGITIAAHIGLHGQEGSDLFYLTVCTPKWLAQQQFQKGFCWGFGYLFVSHWDLDLVRRAIHDACIRATSPDWNTSAIILSRYAHWEFEGYRELGDE